MRREKLIHGIPNYYIGEAFNPLAGWLDCLDTDIFNDLTFCVAVMRGEFVRVSPNVNVAENKIRKRV